MRASLDKIHEKAHVVTNEFQFKIRGNVNRELKEDLQRMKEQKENFEIEFLQGKWINSVGSKICVTGKKCIFLDAKKNQKFDIIDENENFVMNNWECAKQQRRYSANAVIWTHRGDKVKWTRLENREKIFNFKKKEEKRWNVSADMQNFPFKINAVGPGGQFESLGIEVGWMITEVNDIPVNDATAEHLRDFLYEGDACTLTFIEKQKKEDFSQQLLQEKDDFSQQTTSLTNKGHTKKIQWAVIFFLSFFIVILSIFIKR